MPNPFGRNESGEPEFDGDDEFVPDYLPEPGPHLTDHEILAGEEHVAVHRMVGDVFEDRGVSDSTFGYNLATLNLDPRHPDAGFRYAIENRGDDESDADAILHVEFTPTTAVCPQGDVLATAASRALNGLADRHRFDRVAVHVAPIHQDSDAINEKLDGMTLEEKESRERSERSGTGE
jgi:hypothetical protein